jgi:dTDP-4-dehydrorhamnose reductase
MLGQALMQEGERRGFEMIGGRVELRDTEALMAHVDYHQPDLIINAAAVTDIAACEESPGLAYEINTLPVLAIIQGNTRLVQISTDRYSDNVYAKTKQAAEDIALLKPDNLVVRTNIVGFRGHGKPTFAEWAIDVIETGKPVTLFDDFYARSIDVWSFSEILFDLLELDISGRIDIASREEVSKKQFVEALAAKIGKPLNATVGSIKGLTPARLPHCTLDVSGVERLLRRPMPDLDDVVNSLVERRKPCTNPLLLTDG